MRSKYSWYEKRIFSYEAPAATTFAQASTTAYAAPWYGLQLAMNGLYPNAMIDAVSVYPSVGSFCTETWVSVV